MARIKLAPLVTSISGSIGGLTIQRNKFGTTLRSKPLPLQSATESQLTVRNHMLTIQAAWQALTDAQRLQWDRFVDYSGQTIKNNNAVKLGGHGLYLKYQMFRLLAGESLLTTITYIPMPAYELIEKIEQVGASLKVYFNAAVDKDLYFFTLKLTNPRKVSTSFSAYGLRYIKIALADADNFEMWANYLKAFGAAPGVASYVHVSIQYWSVLAPVYSGVLTSILQVE